MKFDPALYNKAWAAFIAAFASQWGLDTNESINQILLTPPENMGQALIMAGVVAGAVWYVRNKKDDEDDKIS